MVESLKGKKKINTSSSPLNAMDFLIWQSILKINTLDIVVVTNIANDTLEVQSLTAGVSGSGAAIPPGTIYDVPFTRIQGGVNSLKIDPQVGDIGLCGFCQRDISSVKTNKRLSVPPSDKAYAVSDAVYICGIASLNNSPQRFIEINDEGITIEASGPVNLTATDVNVDASESVTIVAPDMTFEGDVTIEGNIEHQGELHSTGVIRSDLNVTGATVSLVSHVHGGVTPGNSTTTGPQ